MSKFNIGNKVVSKRYPYLGEELGVIVGIDTRENAFGKYLVKFDSLEISEGLSYRDFVDNIINNTYCITEPYEGYAIWLEEEDLTKVEEECEEEVMSEFNIGDRVVAKDYPSIVKEVGVVVGIDPREGFPGKYLVKFDSLEGYNGWAYGVFVNNPYYNIEPYEGRAIWLDDLEKVENESEEVCMNEFNIGDKVVSKDSCYSGKEVGVIVGIDPKAKASGKYLVKFDSIKGLEYELFCNNPDLIVEPYEGYAMWLDDLEKVEEECEEEVMNEFNIGDKVFSNDGRYYGKDVGVIVGINPEGKYGKYLVKFDSLDMYEGWSYGYSFFVNNPELVIEPYEGRAIWLDDLIKIVKVEDEYEKGECEEECEEDKHEEDIKMEFDKIREQKKEVIKSISEKVLEMTLEIKEMEHEIEKIKKEWHLD